MTKKQFFHERTPAEIRKLSIKEIYRQKDLVKKIDDLDPASDGLIIRAQIIPGRFRKKGLSGAEASKKCLKHGDIIPLPQHQTLEQTLYSFNIPMDLREEAFYSIRKEMKSEEVNFIGYSWRPVKGRDRTKRVVLFYDISEGARLFTYALNNSIFSSRNRETGEIEEKYGIKILDYPDAKKVKTEGATVIAEIPSRTKKQSKYRFKLLHVPYKPHSPDDDNNYNLAAVMSLKPAVIREITEENSEIDSVSRTAHDDFMIRFPYEDMREESPLIYLTHLDIAAYQAVIQKQLQMSNITALQYNPFALPSRHQAEFYTKLNNNILIYDPTLASKDKLRKLHLAEKAILLGRGIIQFGHGDFSFWDPTRDGIFKNYSWHPVPVSPR